MKRTQGFEANREKIEATNANVAAKPKRTRQDDGLKIL